METMGPAFLALAAWMSPASSSFPVPLSPNRSTVSIEEATRITVAITAAMMLLFPMMPCSSDLDGGLDREDERDMGAGGKDGRDCGPS